MYLDDKVCPSQAKTCHCYCGVSSYTTNTKTYWAFLHSSSILCFLNWRLGRLDLIIAENSESSLIGKSQTCCVAYQTVICIDQSMENKSNSYPYILINTYINLASSEKKELLPPGKIWRVFVCAIHQCRQTVLLISLMISWTHQAPHIIIIVHHLSLWNLAYFCSTAWM